MQKSIIFLYYDQDIVNGGFFDNFEYYYLTKKLFVNENVILRIVSDSNKEKVFKFINDKYENVEDFIFEGIEIIRHKVNMIMLNPAKIDLLICPTNSSLYWFLENKGFIVAKNVIAMGDFLEHHQKYSTLFDYFHFFYDERIFERRSELDVPYRKKILFDKYHRKNYDSKYDYMLNMSLIERQYPRQFFDHLFERFKGTYLIYTGSKNKEFYSWMNKLNFIRLIQPPIEDFMGLFKTFIYIPYNNGWDATPRLIPECVFYNKEIIYYDNDSAGIKAGGFYRYQDTKTDFKSLWLKEEDEVFGYIRDILG